ncbi:MAG: prolipoprotein diacylglyceryl transferase [Proteobacteria bacterium]|jgi:phosphatidylglycerol---prolipoprotein diacylglyceryl transferase|nr:prolipoprotein diacylglyceryl transferase [Pseudomonadota bacterium]
MNYPEIDPVALQIGPIAIHWYGLMYLLSFLLVYLLGNYRAKQPGSGWNKEQVSDLVFFSALGVVLGGRLGYALFYNFASYADNPLNILKVWEGGMSFHGGLIGVTVATMLFARSRGKTFLQVADFAAVLAPVGLFLGRIANFINQELWGRVTDMPWGIIFPLAGTQPRHPSMLYEALLEGIVLFAILWWFSSSKRSAGKVAGLFLWVYGAFRFLVEFVREPDAHIGFLAGDWFTTGHLLCLPMMAIGLWLLLKRSSINP